MGNLANLCCRRYILLTVLTLMVAMITAAGCAATYSLNVNTVGEGTVAVSPDKGRFGFGEEATLEARPAAGWTFTRWSGNADGSENPISMGMDGDKTLTATFEPVPTAKHTLTISITGSGTVARSLDQPTYATGENITLTAAAAAGWQFQGWSGDCTGAQNPASLTILADTVVTAAFVPENSGVFSLSVTIVGSGTVSQDPERVTYAAGTQVALTAIPAGGWIFSGWSGDAAGKENSIRITVDNHKAITAVFTAIPAEFTLEIRVTGSGTVTTRPDSASYSPGSTVTLIADPAPGWVFAGWSGDADGDSNPKTLTVSKDLVLRASFTIEQGPGYKLDADVTGWGSVQIDPNQGSYASGSEVTLTARPFLGWHFVRWSGDVTGTERTVTLTMSRNMKVRAHFKFGL